MTDNKDLINRVDLENILKMGRCAGGHDIQMRGLLKNVTIIAHWNEGDYSGQVATMVELNDTKEVVIYSDYYGSCSGCDAWEEANDTEVKNMSIGIAATSKIFKTKEEAINFLKSEKEEGKDFDFDTKVRYGLLKEMSSKGGKQC